MDPRRFKLLMMMNAKKRRILEANRINIVDDDAEPCVEANCIDDDEKCIALDASTPPPSAKTPEEIMMCVMDSELSKYLTENYTDDEIFLYTLLLDANTKTELLKHQREMFALEREIKVPSLRARR